MIDDFENPIDDGYGYDQYRIGMKLSINLIKSSLTKYNLVTFFPSVPSVKETGGKRGCVILTNDEDISIILENEISKLIKYIY